MVYGEKLSEREYIEQQKIVKKIQSYLTVFILGVSAGLLFSSPLEELDKWNYAQGHPIIQQPQPTHTPQLNKSLLKKL